MKTKLLVALVALATCALSFVGATPTATAAVDCTPTITMGQPYQTAGGMVYFPADYTTCDTSKVTVKFRDRDAANGWGKGSGVGPAATTGTTYSGTCPVGEGTRFVAYATIKTATGPTILAQSQKVYFKSAPVKWNCKD